MYQRRTNSNVSEPEADGNMPSSVYTPNVRKRGSAGRTRSLFILLIFLVLVTLFYPRLVTFLGGSPPPQPSGASLASIGPVLVSYSYFEKDMIQVGTAQGRRSSLWPPAAAAAQPNVPALMPCPCAAREL
jgi:hypothetical protein